MVGGRMVGVRYSRGRVLVRIQDLLLVDAEEGFSVRWAAGKEKRPQLTSDRKRTCSSWTANVKSKAVGREGTEKKKQPTSPLPNRHPLPPRQLYHLHPKPHSQRLLRLLKHRLELPRPLLAQHLGADVRPPDRLPRVLARQGQPHQLLHHHVGAAGGVSLFIILFVAGGVFVGRVFFFYPSAAT